MTSRRNSKKDDDTLLSFLILVGILIGVYYIAKRIIGFVPAIIITVLLFLHRRELKEDFSGLVGGKDETTTDKP